MNPAHQTSPSDLRDPALNPLFIFIRGAWLQLLLHAHVFNVTISRLESILQTQVLVMVLTPAYLSSPDFEMERKLIVNRMLEPGVRNWMMPMSGMEALYLFHT